VNLLTQQLEQKKSEWFQKLFKNSHIGILVVDHKRNNLLVNPHLCKMFGYSEDELLGKNAEIFHISHQNYLDFAQKAFNIVLKGKTIDLEYPFQKKDGTRIWVRISGDVLRKDQEVLWTFVDITARVQLEEELRAKEKQMLSMNALVHLGTWEIYLQNGQITLSDEMCKILGLKQGSQIDLDYYFKDILHPDDREIAKEGLDILLAGDETNGSYLRIFRKREDGEKEIRYVYQKGLLLQDEDGNAFKLIGATQDITEYKKLQMELQQQKDRFEYQAYHDVLTGLPNRLLLRDRLKEKIKYAKRHKKKLAVLFLDLDNFKSLNDSLGHDAGDYFLQKLAQRMRKQLRESDTIARLGGDEFVILVDDIHLPQSITEIIIKGLHEVNEPILVKNRLIYPRMSIGVALYPDDGTDSETLLKNADAAMYKAKKSGRHTYSFYTESMTQEAYKRITLEQELKQAITNEQLVVYFQPQVDARSLKQVGMEALIRWNHPKKGLIFPVDFIPFTESTDFIIEIDRYMMRKAISTLQRWHEEGLNPGVLSLNLAIRNLQSKDFFSFFTETVEMYGCKYEWLGLEVTETQLMNNPDKSIAILQKLSDFGVTISIDDFGTGYSSLAYLKQLPIHKLKIDRSFIIDIPQNKEDAAIVQAVVALAKALNLEIVVEGVELKRQIDFLVENGCYVIQGFYYSKAIDDKAMEERLRLEAKKPINKSESIIVTRK